MDWQASREDYEGSQPAYQADLSASFAGVIVYEAGQLTGEGILLDCKRSTQIYEIITSDY